MRDEQPANDPHDGASRPNCEADGQEQSLKVKLDMEMVDDDNRCCGRDMRLGECAYRAGAEVVDEDAHRDEQKDGSETGRVDVYAHRAMLICLPNTGDKLRASNTLNARLLHPLVRPLVALRTLTVSTGTPNSCLIASLVVRWIARTRSVGPFTSTNQ